MFFSARTIIYFLVQSFPLTYTSFVHILFVCRLSFFSAKRLRHLQVVQLSLETLMRNVHRVLLAPFVTVLPRMPWNSAMAAFGRHW